MCRVTTRTLASHNTYICVIYSHMHVLVTYSKYSCVSCDCSYMSRDYCMMVPADRCCSLETELQAVKEDAQALRDACTEKDQEMEVR